MAEMEIKDKTKADLTRVLYTVLYLIIGRFISIVIFIIAVGQLIYSWIKGEPNTKLLEFSKNMAEYAKEIVLYVSFNSEEKPWPSGDWPRA